MTAAVVTLAVAVVTLAAGLIAAGTLYARLVPKFIAAETERLRVNLDNEGLRAGIIDRDDSIRRKDLIIATVSRERDKYRSRLIVDLPADDVRDIVNGSVPEDRPSGSTGGSAGAVEGDLR